MRGRRCRAIRLALGLRLMAPSLDHQVASGAPPDSELLVERARLLLSRRSCHRLADGLYRLVGAPQVGGGEPAGPPRVDHPAVREASALLIGSSYLSYRFKGLRPILNGEPIVLVEDGARIEANLCRRRLTLAKTAKTGR